VPCLRTQQANFQPISTLILLNAEHQAGFVQCGHFANKRRRRVFLRCGCPSLLGQKNFRFFKIYGVSAQTRRVEPGQAFCEQGREVNFFAM